MVMKEYQESPRMSRNGHRKCTIYNMSRKQGVNTRIEGISCPVERCRVVPVCTSPVYSSLSLTVMIWLQQNKQKRETRGKKVTLKLWYTLSRNRYLHLEDIWYHRCVWPFVIGHIDPDEMCHVNSLFVHSSLYLIIVKERWKDIFAKSHQKEHFFFCRSKTLN